MKLHTYVARFFIVLFWLCVLGGTVGAIEPSLVPVLSILGNVLFWVVLAVATIYVGVINTINFWGQRFSTDVSQPTNDSTRAARP